VWLDKLKIKLFDFPIARILNYTLSWFTS